MDKDQLKGYNNKIIDEFRANGGKVGGDFEGAPMLLLTTMGRNSGVQRTSPLVYTRDGDRLVIVASYAGADRHPEWFLNIQEMQDVTLEVGTETFRARATITEGEERDRLFEQHAALMPNFHEYQKKTSRLIPVVALERLQNS